MRHVPSGFGLAMWVQGFEGQAAFRQTSAGFKSMVLVLEHRGWQLSEAYQHN